MKRLISIALILVLLLPAAALADDKDPIVGCWYIYYDTAEYPEIQSWIPGADSCLFVIIFAETSELYQLSVSFTGVTYTPEYSMIGKWQKDGDSYTLSRIGFPDPFTAYIDGEALIGQFGADKTLYSLHKIEVMNPYIDIRYQQGGK